MRRLLPALALLLATTAALPAFAPAALAQATPETRTAARAMVEASGGTAQARQALTMMRQQLIALLVQSTGKPAPEITGIVDEVLMPEMQAQVPALVEGMAEIWAGQLSAAELQELVTFYGTPIGKKLIAVSPVVATQTLPLATAWGQKVATEALAKQRDALRARGLNL